MCRAIEQFSAAIEFTKLQNENEKRERERRRVTERERERDIGKNRALWKDRFSIVRWRGKSISSNLSTASAIVDISEDFVNSILHRFEFKSVFRLILSFFIYKTFWFGFCGFGFSIQRRASVSIANITLSVCVWVCFFHWDTCIRGSLLSQLEQIERNLVSVSAIKNAIIKH